MKPTTLKKVLSIGAAAALAIGAVGLGSSAAGYVVAKRGSTTSFNPFSLAVVTKPKSVSAVKPLVKVTPSAIRIGYRPPPRSPHRPAARS